MDTSTSMDHLLIELRTQLIYRIARTGILPGNDRRERIASGVDT
jgi:hypothetical protein